MHDPRNYTKKHEARRITADFGASQSSVSTSSAAPFDHVRQYEQIQTGEQEQEERGKGQVAHPNGRVVPCQDNRSDDDSQGEGDREPSVRLPNQVVQVQLEPPIEDKKVTALRIQDRLQRGITASEKIRRGQLNSDLGEERRRIASHCREQSRRVGYR